MLEFLLQRFVGGSHGMQTRPDGIAFLKVAKSLYPLESVEYLALNIPLGSQHGRFLHCAYSDVGLSQCATKDVLDPSRFDDIAPALSQPIDWSELAGIPAASAVPRLAEGSGAGSRLLSLPVRAIAGEQALLLLATRMPNGDWQAQKELLLREFQVLGNYFHQHILRIYGRDAAKDMLISARELDCLKWIAAGKTAWEASVILGISERTVRFHLNGAREKLNDHHAGGGEGRITAADLSAASGANAYVLTSSRCLSSGSISPRAQERADGWIPGTSTGMTTGLSLNVPGRPSTGCRARAA
jgi:DNA-binding CsgD family transcriptional regulator